MDRRCLLVTLGDDTFAVPLHQLVGVEPVTRLIPLPHVPSWVLGATHRQGTVLSVIDLAILLGLSVQPLDPASARLLVAADDELQVAFAVARVTETRSFSDDVVDSAPVPATGRVARFLSGTIPEGERRIGVLNLPELLRSAELVQAA